ncbi:16916_t:CDS:2 [Entrophospora sp. SA101]|nr:16916_t:CDS:2 [Entrophospora sp. SA101]
MNYYMNENEWLSLKELLELLKKFAEATELLDDASELNLYLKIPQISIKENVKNHLSKLIKHIKKISSSSVPAERDFSMETLSLKEIV